MFEISFREFIHYVRLLPFSAQCGGGGIRTPMSLLHDLTVFKTVLFTNLSTPPLLLHSYYTTFILFFQMFLHFFVGMMGVEPTIRRNGFLDRRVCQFRHTPIFFVGMKGLEPLRPKTQHPKCCAPTNFATSP